MRARSTACATGLRPLRSEFLEAFAPRREALRFERAAGLALDAQAASEPARARRIQGRAARHLRVRMMLFSDRRERRRPQAQRARAARPYVAFDTSCTARMPSSSSDRNLPASSSPRQAHEISRGRVIDDRIERRGAVARATTRVLRSLRDRCISDRENQASSRGALLSR